MNILLLTSTMKQPDDTFSGKTDLVFYFAKEWKKMGHNVVIIHNESKFPLIYYNMPQFVYNFFLNNTSYYLPSKESRKPLYREQNGIVIIRLPMFKAIPHMCFTNNQYNEQINKITAHLDKLNFVPDVITGHWLEPQLKLINILGERYNSKKGFVVHGKLPLGLKEEYKLYITNLDCLFFRSTTIMQEFLSDYRYSYKPERVRICYSGVPDEFYENRVERNDWKTNGIFHISYVGRLVSYKRVDAILVALSKYCNKYDFIFDIVGDGPETQNLRNMCIDLGISNKVVFHGRLDRETVQNLLRKADCFTLISENEVFGLVYLEALNAGCVTIASRGGGVDGIIVDGYNGFLCGQGDYDELGMILTKVMNLDKSVVERIRKSAINTVGHYTDSEVAKKYLDDICG